MQTDVVVIIRDGGPGSRSWIRSTDSEGQDGGLVEHPEDLPRIVSILEDALKNALAQAGMIDIAAPAVQAVELQSGTYSTLPTHEQKLRAAELILKACPEDEAALAFLRTMLADRFTADLGTEPQPESEERRRARNIDDAEGNFEQGRILEVTPVGDGWSVTYDNGCRDGSSGKSGVHFLRDRLKGVLPPQVGDLIRVYVDGGPVRGQMLRGKLLWYETPEEALESARRHLAEHRNN